MAPIFVSKYGVTYHPALIVMSTITVNISTLSTELEVGHRLIYRRHRKLLETRLIQNNNMINILKYPYIYKKKNMFYYYLKTYDEISDEKQKLLLYVST